MLQVIQSWNRDPGLCFTHSRSLHRVLLGSRVVAVVGRGPAGPGLVLWGSSYPGQRRLTQAKWTLSQGRRWRRVFQRRVAGPWAVGSHGHLVWGRWARKCWRWHLGSALVNNMVITSKCLLPCVSRRAEPSAWIISCSHVVPAVALRDKGLIPCPSYG